MINAYYFINGWDKSISVSITYENGLIGWWGIINNATGGIDMPASYSSGNSVMASMEGQVIAFVFYGNETYEINYNVTLSKGESDCIACVIKGKNLKWNADTFCSTKS